MIWPRCQAGGQHEPGRRHGLASAGDAEGVGRGLDRVHARVRKIPASKPNGGRMQGPEQRQRRALTVVGGVGAADDGGADPGHDLGHAFVIEHLVVETDLPRGCPEAF